MKRNNRSTIFLLTFLWWGCMMNACEMYSEENDVESAVSTTLDEDLKEVLDMMHENPQGAISKCEELIDLGESISSPYYSGKAKWYQAFIYDKIIEDVSKAYFGYNEALEDLKKTDDVETIVKVSNNLAILNQYYSQYTVAVDIYLNALTYGDQIDPELLSDIYFNLGRTYKLMGTKEAFFKAEDAFTESLEVAEAAEYDENIASVNNQVGTMYKDLKNYDLARIAFQNTIRTYANEDPSSELLDYVGKAYHGIGVTYMEEEKSEEAIAAFEKALEYEQQSGTIFITKYDLGTVLHDAGKIEQSIAMWKEALQEKHNKNDRIHVDIYANLTSALASVEEFQEAVHYAQLYNEEIQNILTVGERYKSENNEVIFADIIRDYEEFNRVVPFYKQPWAILLLIALISAGVYLTSMWYYRSKITHRVSETMTELQVEFQNIKVD